MGVPADQSVGAASLAAVANRLIDSPSIGTFERPVMTSSASTRPTARTELEAVRREAERMEHAGRGRARADHRDVVGHPGLDPGPGADDLGPGHDREQRRGGARVVGEPGEVEIGAIAVAIGPAAIAAADQHGAVLVLLERQRTPLCTDHRPDETGHPRGDHQHRRDHLQRHRLAELAGNAIGPCAGAVDDHRSLVRPGVGLDLPHAADLPQVADLDAFDEAGAEALRLALERENGAIGHRGAVGAADDGADAMWRDRRQQVAQLGLADDLLVIEPEQPDLLDPGALQRKLGLGLGDLDLTVAFEAAVVVDEMLDPVPQLHRGNRQRHLRQVASEPPHAAGIDAGGMAAGVVLLDQQRLHAAHRQMQCRRAPLDAAADDDRVRQPAGRRGAHRRTDRFPCRVRLRQAGQLGERDRLHRWSQAEVAGLARRDATGLRDDLGDGGAAQPALARAHAAAQERLELVRAIGADCDRLADLAGGDLLAAANNGVVGGDAKRRRRAVKAIDEGATAHGDTKVAAHCQLVRQPLPKRIDGADRRDPGEPPALCRHPGATDAGAVAGDGDALEWCRAEAVDLRHPAQLHVVPDMRDADAHRQVDVRDDALVQQQMIDRHALDAAGLGGIGDAFDLAVAMRGKRGHAADDARLASDVSHQLHAFREVMRAGEVGGMAQCVAAMARIGGVENGLDAAAGLEQLGRAEPQQGAATGQHDPAFGYQARSLEHGLRGADGHHAGQRPARDWKWPLHGAGRHDDPLRRQHLGGAANRDRDLAIAAEAPHGRAGHVVHAGVLQVEHQIAPFPVVTVEDALAADRRRRHRAIDLATGTGIFVEQHGRQAAPRGHRRRRESCRAGADDRDVILCVEHRIAPHRPASRRARCVSIRMPSVTLTRQPCRLPTPSIVTRHSKHTPIMQ